MNSKKPLKDLIFKEHPPEIIRKEHFDNNFILNYLSSGRSILKNAKGHLASKKKIALVLRGLLQLNIDFGKGVGTKIAEANDIIYNLKSELEVLKASINHKNDNSDSLPDAPG